MDVKAQSSSFMSDGVADYIRRSQLDTCGYKNYSFAVNRFISNYNIYNKLVGPVTEKKISSKKLIILPAQLTYQFNNKTPSGQNDAGMIPARGSQLVFSGGVIKDIGNFTLQFKPEIVWAENQNFETFPTEHYNDFWRKYYDVLNRIDNPEMIVKGSYSKILPGQTSIKYNLKKLQIGFSTENLWWGPGRFNSLIMSNNAQGFSHFSINTSDPIKSIAGNVEFQLILGSLKNSNTTPPDRYRYYNGELLYKPKPIENRYIAGLVLSWQPKWVNGLFVGFTAVNYGYDRSRSTSIGSLFARYAMPLDNAEIYFEFGRNDKVPGPINLIADNDYPRGYVVGGRKMIRLSNKSFIEVATEFTQLQMPTRNLTFNGESWYTSKKVVHGYTNNGQVLGAAIGPGSNSQILSVSHIKGFRKMGIQFERLLHNNDFYYNAFIQTGDHTRHWVDLSSKVYANIKFKNVLLNSTVGLTRSLNYQWYILEGLGYYKNGYDLLNFHCNVSIAYCF